MNQSATSQSITTFWEGLFLPTIERNELTWGTDLQATGFITGVDKEGEPLFVRYSVTLSKSWEFKEALIEKNGSPLFKIKLQNTKWFVNGKARPDLDACKFIDINVTPFTNSLPINGLDFNTTAVNTLDVVFIDLLKNDVRSNKQSYTKISPTHFEYKNLESGFTRVIETDQNGLTVHYPGIWRKIMAPTPFADALVASSTNTSIEEVSKMYSWLIGSWHASVIDYMPKGESKKQTGEWHFSWILEGRAIQDVWIVPTRDKRKALENNNRYGTTIRWYNSVTQQWNITWFNPISETQVHLAGRKIDDKLYHHGIDEDGHHHRWIFQDITPNSFHWTGEVSTDAGKSWTLTAEFFATKINP